MKQFVIILFVLMTGFWACHDVTIGYLDADNAQYVPDSMFMRQVPDPSLDWMRIKYEAPWVSPKIQGVLGTAAIWYKIIGVSADQGGDAELMREISSIDGAGVIAVPLENELPKGRYFFDIEIGNEGYHQSFSKIYTIIVQ